MFRAVMAGLLIARVLLPADDAKAPIASNPVVQVAGRITKVEPFRPGAGMPSIVVDVNGASTTVVLGSMRYLLAENFNPKAGADVQVKGYKVSDSIVAIEVKLTSDGKTLKLRDEDGWPLWRGGGGGQHHGRRGMHSPRQSRLQ